MAPARDQLLRLREELDIADAAPAQLDVVAAHGDRPMALELVHAPLHGMDVGHRGEVQISPPDEGRQVLEKGLAEGAVARRDTRLDQRRPFPVLAEALVVDQGGFGRERDLRRAGIGPEPQIRPVDIAVLGLLLQEAHQVACQPHEEGRRLHALGEPCPFGVVEHHEVDVGRVVQLHGAELAHGDHEIAVRLVRRDLPGGKGLAEQIADRGPDRRIGRFAQTGQRLGRRPDAAEIGERRQ
ncbi:hypothetical protein AUC68_08395 [Methyloceanibacter methanicus]|uniref:Uncharacterized protein n=1 Tax=Methyloceanibacter methanicus TaxID=1774968 RepID=A0A1E3VY44_9HYPH|nr:hypothetical protein [Methyloceanibacter methanicus]ODR98443.1 hypothetical protein AUC68_08395 [Methyloceanibacter methanicus]